MSRKFGKEKSRHNGYRKLDNFIISHMANFVNTIYGGEKMDYYKALRAEINKQKTLRDMTNSDLAKATNLAESTINGFMGGKRYSELVDRKLRDLFGISKNIFTSDNA